MEVPGKVTTADQLAIINWMKEEEKSGKIDHSFLLFKIKLNF